MSEDERKRKTALGLVERALQQHAQLHDTLLALKRSIEGSNPTGEIFQHFADCWQRRYHAKYEFNGAVDGNHIKRLLKVFDTTTLKGRLSRFFADSDPFLVKNRHAFNVFVGRINTYATPTGGNETDAVGFDADAAPVVGCTHAPQCRTDAEHTRKRMADFRR